MKKLLYLILIVGSNCFGQEVELQGRYSASFLGAESITFVGKDSFYFHGFYCTYGVAGKGVCEIRNNYLYLNFEKLNQDQAIDSFRMISLNKKESEGDFYTIDLFCADRNGKPMMGLTVMASNGTQHAGALTGKNGEAKLRIHRRYFPVTLTISGAETISHTIKLPDSADYSINVSMPYGPLEETLDNGEMKVYEIDEITEDMISLRPSNSQGRFYKYFRRHPVDK